MGLSHVALVMKKDDNPMVYKNRGRPANEEIRSIEINDDMRKELAEPKRKNEIQSRN